MSDTVTEQEAFEHSLRNFLEWLHVLTMPPIELCDIWGNYNVAWELVADLKADGDHTITSPCSQLSIQQKQSVEIFLERLNSIPQSLLTSATSVAANQEAMSHPCWTPLRQAAAMLIHELAPVAKINREFFFRKPS